MSKIDWMYEILI